MTGPVPGTRGGAAQAPARQPSLGAVLAVGAFALLSLAGGWLIVLGGGFHHAPGRRASGTVFVDGAPALAMALLQFLAAALALAWLLRPRLGRWPAALVAAALTIAPPLLLMPLPSVAQPAASDGTPASDPVPLIAAAPPPVPPARLPTGPPPACRCG